MIFREKNVSELRLYFWRLFLFSESCFEKFRSPKKTVMPELAGLAQDVLATCASFVPSEQSFSMASKRMASECSVLRNPVLLTLPLRFCHSGACWLGFSRISISLST